MKARGAVAALTALVTSLGETRVDPAAIQARFAKLFEHATAMKLANSGDESTILDGA